jgi:hypothetical protein
MYYCCLYKYIDDLNDNETPELVHFCGAYPGFDFALLLISFIFIRKVKVKSRELIDNKRFKEYNTEAEIALGEILYLP